MDKEFEKRIRNKRYLNKIMEQTETAKFVKPDMTLGVSGFTIADYPKVIAGELAKRVDNGEKLNLTVYSEVLQNSIFDLIGAGKVKCPSGTSLTISWDIINEFFQNFEKYKDKIVLRLQ